MYLIWGDIYKCYLHTVRVLLAYLQRFIEWIFDYKYHKNEKQNHIGVYDLRIVCRS